MALQCTHTPVLARALNRMNTVHVVLAEYTAKIAPGLSVWALWWCILSCILGQHQPVDVPWYQTGADGYLVEESGDNRVRLYQFICTFFGQVVCGVSKSQDWSGLHFRGEWWSCIWKLATLSPPFSSHRNNLSTSLSSTCCLYFRRQRACSFYMYAYHVVPGGKASIVLREAFHSVTISPPCTLMMWQRPYTLFLNNFFMTYTCICLPTDQW